MKENDRLLVLREVLTLTRLSKPTLYKLVRENKFPGQLRISEQRVAWLQSEVLAWIDLRASRRAVA